MQQALTGALVAVGVILVLAATCGFLYGAVKFYRQLVSLNDSMKGVPALLEGILNICQSLSESTVRMGDSVDKFGKTVLSEAPTSESRRDGFRPYDVNEAARAWQEQQRLQNEAADETFQVFSDS